MPTVSRLAASIPCLRTGLALSLLAIAGCTALPASARPAGWGSGWNDGWGVPSLLSDGPARNSRNTRDDREGRVEVDRFVADGDAASLLGHGTVSVTSATGEGDWMTPADRRVFEAAVEDRLIHAGYDTLRAATARRLPK